MILTKLTLKNRQNVDDKTWVFQQGSEQLKHFWVFFAPPKILSELRSTITQLFNTKSANKDEISLEIHDALANIWHMINDKGEAKFFKNHAYFDSNINMRNFFTSFFEKELSDEEKDALVHYQIQKRDNSVLALPLLDNNLQQKNVDLYLKKQIDGLKESCSIVLGYDCPETTKIIQLKHKIEPLYHQYKTLNKQYFDVAKLAQDNDFNKLTESVNNLKKEIVNLQHMRSISNMLPSPMQVDSSIKNLQELERKIASHFNALQIEQMPGDIDTKNWDIPTEKLSYLKSIEKILSFIEGRTKESMEVFSPLYNNYMQSVENLFNSDNELYKELRKFIESLSKRHERVENSIKNDPTITLKKNWLNRKEVEEKKKFVDKQKGEAQEELASINSIYTCIEDIFSTINQTKEKINECYEATSSGKKELDGFSATYSDKLKQLKEEWEKIADEYKLPVTMDIEDLASYRLKFFEIGVMSKQAKIMSEFIKETAARSNQLKDLIEEWQLHTGSQKLLSLNSLSAILSEAKNILRYQEEKEQKFKQLVETLSDYRFSQNFKTSLESRGKKIMLQWKKVFNEENIPALSLKDQRTQQFIDEATLMEKLVFWKKELNQAQAILPFTTKNPSFNTWSVYSGMLNQKEKEMLLNHITVQSELMKNNVHLILTDDPELYQSLTKAEVGNVTLQNSAPEVKKKPTAQVTAPPPPSLNKAPEQQAIAPYMIRSKQESDVNMSQRAKNVLELLNKVKKH